MVEVHFDMRSFINKIRYSNKGKKILSVNENPGIKTEIYERIFDADIFNIPEETSALANSPYGKSDFVIVKGNHFVVRTANGYIDDEGIHFDPYEETTDGEHHYAPYVKNFLPYVDLMDNKKIVNEIIKDVIVKDVNNG